MKKTILNLFSFFFSITLIILLLSAIDLAEMLNALINVKLSFYSFAFVLYIVSYYARAMRLFILFNPKKFNKYFLIICGHMLVNHIFPFRTGELSLPFFLKRANNIPYSMSISLIILLRLFDVISVIVTFLFVLILFGFHLSSKIILVIVILLFICLSFILNLKIVFSEILKLISKILPKMYEKKIEEFNISTEKALKISRKKFFNLFFLSILDRIFGYGMAISLVIGMSYKIPIFHIIIANAVASLTNIIPINSFGSFGTLELGWAGALLLYGVPKEIAISSGFSFHILAFSFTISLGLISIFLMKRKFNINPFIRGEIFK